MGYVVPASGEPSPGEPATREPATGLLNRRATLLGAAAAFSPVVLNALAGSALAQAPGTRFSTLSVIYRTDPTRIARVLPPPLVPDDDPLVQIDFFVAGPTGPSTVNVMMPSDYFETGLHVAARHGEHRGLLQLNLGLNQEWGRSQGREGPGWVKKDGKVRLDWDGGAIRAGYSRRGKTITRLSATATEKPAHPRLWMREFGWGGFLYRHRLDPDWRRGLIDREYGVELWRLGGNDLGFPTEPDEGGPGTPRVLDPASIRLEFPEPSVLDPWAEFPVVEIIGGSFSGSVGQPISRPRRPGSAQQSINGARAVFMEAVDPVAFERFALFSYDRPCPGGKPLTPGGWPTKTSSFTLTPEEVLNYRSRPSIDASGTVIDMTWNVAPDVHRRTLPPPLGAGSQPEIRMLAFSVKSSNQSPVAYDELWLLSRCLNDGLAGWYALSHIVGDGGDVLMGRETWGYPSKVGEVAIGVSKHKVEVTGHRLLRSFAQITAQAKSSVTVAPEAFELTGLCARFNRPGTDDPLKAHLVSQPWKLITTGAKTLTDITMTLPREPAPGRIGLPDPWFELMPSGPVSGRLANLRLERSPGRKGVQVANFLPFFMERYDGTKSAQTEPSTSTFLAGPSA